MLEKINIQKIYSSPEFQRGRQEFLNRQWQPEPAKYRWYKAKVDKKKWNDWYSKSGYSFLGEEKDGVWVGFLSVVEPEGCLEMTDLDELRRVDLHRQATNHLPYVMN